MIKHSEIYETPTIVDIKDNLDLVLESEYFKKALSEVSIIPFVKYKEDYYYLLEHEFRLIDNNILFLINELRVKSSSKLTEILRSSMLKEEGWSNVFKIAVVESNEKPPFSNKVEAEFVFDKIDMLFKEKAR